MKTPVHAFINFVNLFFSSLILTDDTRIEDDGLFKMEHIFYSTHHYDRCRALCMKDPVHTVVLLNYFDSQVCFPTNNY